MKLCNSRGRIKRSGLKLSEKGGRGRRGITTWCIREVNGWLYFVFVFPHPGKSLGKLTDDEMGVNTGDLKLV